MVESQSQDAGYPEHEKLKGVQEQSQACGEFIVWLQREKLVQLGRPHVHDGQDCYEPHDCEEHSYDCRALGRCNRERTKICGYESDQFQPYHGGMEDLLAEFFGIDREKLDEEKSRMLEELRSMREVREDGL